ncbi:G-type lectin S-receptor-like serine/threonine-protein kinase At2g19130 [Impatiens glandulifera]|uniref:G-type lectin S-receptor-like serine/threonine-protein kinase At2g19130 n=1 Tax=Impatiens glandulifera TaxID=253017 RepID=UPI001FB13384|nr:G-type lectin S-receptor-like serine/threonine-protein kinase At2g19130 [Impatiens glandulifera]
MGHDQIVWCSFLLFHIFFTTHFCKGSDSISLGQSLSGNKTLISAGEIFELGFFTPGNSQNYYIGIWYYKQFQNKTVVWVANRERPVSNPSSSQLKLLPNGNLVLLNQSKSIIWSTNSISTLQNPTRVTLLDNGNLVVLDTSDSAKFIWQSFDYPTDHWLPGGKVGFSKLRNLTYSLCSWRNSENPASSLFSVEVKPSSSHALLWNHSKLYWESGEWDGKVFKYVPEIALDYYVKNITYVSNENESYFTYESAISSAFTRFSIGLNGQLEQFVWQSKGFQDWSKLWTRPPERCEVYRYCGSFGICSQNLPVCSCAIGFRPSNQHNWDLGDHSEGCVRDVANRELNCSQSGFSIVRDIRYAVNSELVMAVGSVSECRLACLRNCSCNAYGYDNGCLIWNEEMFGLRQLSEGDTSGRVLYVKTFMELTEMEGKKAGIRKLTVWIIVGSVLGFVVISSGFGFLLVLMSRRRKVSRSAAEDSLFVFKLGELKSATKNFSEKLGEGGFGSVFKGTISQSTNSFHVAVKVIKNMKQGEKQFRSEVSTIGNVHHVNLVRLRGLCMENTKRILVYEYMPKGSLESHLFNNDSFLLDWKTRYGIAVGTARGLTYLHEGCRDRIIHCDIKPENILLDENYVPKVADFGMAKLLGREFSRVLTTMRGTRGYLAPEWISGDAITPKADVFSLGMVLFEIISGKRNRESSVDNEGEGNYYYFPARVANALNNNGGEIGGLLDKRLTIDDNSNREEIVRVCKVACWCIQDNEKDRPNMAQVVQMLEGIVEVEIPPIPRFLHGLSNTNADKDQVFYHSSSSQEV